jgi:hypothetical protein
LNNIPNPYYNQNIKIGSSQYIANNMGLEYMPIHLSGCTEHIILSFKIPDHINMSELGIPRLLFVPLNNTHGESLELVVTNDSFLYGESLKQVLINEKNI